MASTGLLSGRVYRFNDYGGPDKLYLEQEVIQSPPPAHVRVRVQAISLNQADALFLANSYIEKPDLPSRIGYEIAGVVDAVGQGVKRFRVGDRVSSVPAFALREYGNFADFTVLPERGLMHTPPQLNNVEAASFAFAYFTNYFGLFDLGQLEPFQTVLITAGSSTTGLAAISMVRAVGATAIVTTRKIKKADELFKAGAHYVVATDEEDIVKQVREDYEGQGSRHRLRLRCWSDEREAYPVHTPSRPLDCVWSHGC